MPRLDQRLKSVCGQIRTRSHADIGSDHGHLLKALLCSGRIEFGIAVENKRLPYQNSHRTLHGLSADVRLGSGFEPIGRDEIQSASICGMGGGTIRQILSDSVQKLPPRLILQPNNRSDVVRRWALRHGYHLVDEWLTPGRRAFEVLVLQRSSEDPDPVYHFEPTLDDTWTEVAIQLGPFHLRRRTPDQVVAWQAERKYLLALPRRNEFARLRLSVIEIALAARDDDSASFLRSETSKSRPDE